MQNPGMMGQQAGSQQQQDISQLPSEPQALPNQMGTQELQPPTQQQPTDALRGIIESKNIADGLEDEKLHTIGSEALEGYLQDVESRMEWEKAMEEWTKLATQHKEEKTYPWPKASNVKYPLLTTAAMQFAARSYPSLIPSDGKVVKSTVIGKDPDGSKYAQADRVSMYMSYQLMHEMLGWEEGMDKLLIMLPVVGTIFKKTYWDSITKQVKSDVILPKNLVVNYWAKSLKEAERVSQVIEMSPRILKERQLAGVFLDVDLGSVPTPLKTDDKALPPNDKTTPYTLIEQHTYIDLDDDDYPEPYIVTFHLESGKVLRIAARFDENTITHDDEGKKVIKIEPIEYFTKFGFIPNPDGSFYDLGFGVLLGPINEAVNSLINQLIDSGTLNNLQSGFLGKGLKVRLGETKFMPGEWKAVNSTGSDLKQQIVPLPSKEPSAVLFQLMGSMITSGKELASVAEIFVGKMPGQNTPATTTMATIDQGMKVFTAVYKRIYRSLHEEFQKLFELNAAYLNPNTYQEVINVTIGPADFAQKQYKICPGADPSAISQTEKLIKAQGLQEMLPMGVLDPVKVALRMLEAQEQPNIQDLLNPQVAQTGQLPQRPDPKLQESQAKVQAIQQVSQIKQQEAAQKMQMEQQNSQFKQSMAAQQAQMDLQHKAMLAKLEEAIQIHSANTKTATDQLAANQTLMQNHVDHKQQVVHKHVEHVQKVRQTEQMGHVQRQQAAKQKPPSKGK
jgi:chaperonin GroES